MNAKTLNCMNEMVAWAKSGKEVIPMFFQSHGRATVSAAVRAAKSRGLLVQIGLDGCGNPKWGAPLPKATHAAPAMIQ